MNIFDVLIVQPIFNALLALYGLVGDFGISIIIFTIFVRLLLWPLVKKQLHQTKLMRKIQPELKRIKKQTKGNRMLESQMMMELYRERGIKPFSSIGVLLLQLPIFIGLFVVINNISIHRDQIGKYFYDITTQIPVVADLKNNPNQFNETFLGFVDLTKTPFAGGEPQIFLILLVIATAALQYIQSKQIMPSASSKKRLRDILKEASSGKETDQSEVSAIMTQRMILLMPLMLLGVGLYLPGAVMLYYGVSSLVAVIQQHILLSQDVEDMIEIADEPTEKKEKKVQKKNKNSTVTSTRRIQEAEIVPQKKTKKSSHSKKKKRR